MDTHRIETTLEQDGTLVLTNLPFSAGETVEVLILAKPTRTGGDAYCLRGTPVTYQNPFEPVAVYDWDANQ